MVQVERRGKHGKIQLLMKRILFLIFCGLFLVASPAFADTIGQQQTFQVDKDYDEKGRSSLSATLRHVSDHAYFYIEDAVWSTFSLNGRALFMEDLEDLARNFDTSIWEREREFFGSEPNPGIDEDSHTVILFESLRKGNGGYFDATNVYPKKDLPNSNEREMIVVSIDAIASAYAKSFLAHEFQHLISVNQKEFQRSTNEDVWLNELRSEFAIGLSGFNTPYSGSSLQSRVEAFFRNPSDSLTEWPNVSQDYASVTLFGEYLVGRYGQNILRDTLQSASRGIDSLNRYFSSHSLSERFGDVFSDWMVANYINDGSSRFGYTKSELRALRVSPQSRDLVRGGTTFNQSVSVKDWQPVWQEFIMGQSGVGVDQALKLQISGDSSQNFLLTYVVFFADGTYDVERMPLNQGSRIAYLLSSGVSDTSTSGSQITKVLVALTKAQKTENFGSSELASNIATTVSLVPKETARVAMSDGSAVFNARAQVLRDGSLIRRNNEQDVYVIKGKYKRYMPPQAIGLYGHLNVANVISVTPAVFDSFDTSNYILGIDTKPVYAIWWDSTKHWINISAEQWEASGRDWNAIFVVNQAELGYYARGEDVIR